MFKSLATTLGLAGILLVSGCKNMEGLKKSVTKSDSNVTTTADSKHGDYLTGAPATDVNRFQNANVVKTDRPDNVSRNIDSNAQESSSDGVNYRRDYSTLVGSESPKSTAVPLTRDEMTLRDYNQNIVNQYKSMDELGEVVLFEIAVIEKSWQMNAARYKTANASERDMIARELSKLDDDKLTLYKAYSKIYKQGKSDWINIKSEVENSLLGIRGIR